MHCIATSNANIFTLKAHTWNLKSGSFDVSYIIFNASY